MKSLLVARLRMEMGLVYNCWLKPVMPIYRPGASVPSSGGVGSSVLPVKIMSIRSVTSPMFTSPSRFTSAELTTLPVKIISMTSVTSAMFTSPSPLTSPRGEPIAATTGNKHINNAISDKRSVFFNDPFMIIAVFGQLAKIANLSDIMSQNVLKIQGNRNKNCFGTVRHTCWRANGCCL